jgi:2-oxoglutarate dehydrogenase E1 component
LDWFRNKIEISNRPTFDEKRKISVYNKLVQAANFEAFLGKKYVGQKRFSIEGGEALIPALDALVEKGSDLGVEYFISKPIFKDIFFSIIGKFVELNKNKLSLIL